MDAFTPVVQPEKFHKNFRSCLDAARAPERAEFSRWLEGFPDRDGKFVQEFQTTFNSSFWEAYLFAVFRQYRFELDWTSPSPDFFVRHPLGDFIVEATTANAADGKTKEWDKQPGKFSDGVENLEFGAMNREAMIRLSNALLGKLKAHSDKYSKLQHVKGKPFVVAIAPFEQPDFQYQYDRPIRALLYDYYVDEDAYRRDPAAHPNGPPGIALGFVEKDNGASVPLGIFLNDQWAEISAVVFSCVATWGKVDVLCKGTGIVGAVSSTWGGKPNGKPEVRSGDIHEYSETVEDGLQVFHNPHARYPLNPEVFRRSGVVQHFVSKETAAWVHEEVDNCLHVRLVIIGGVMTAGEQGAEVPPP